MSAVANLDFQIRKVRKLEVDLDTLQAENAGLKAKLLVANDRGLRTHDGMSERVDSLEKALEKARELYANARGVSLKDLPVCWGNYDKEITAILEKKK